LRLFVDNRQIGLVVVELREMLVLLVVEVLEDVGCHGALVRWNNREVVFFDVKRCLKWRISRACKAAKDKR